MSDQQGLRVTSKQVDDLLYDLATGVLVLPVDTIEAICRDWLDMRDRIAALEGRAEAAERVVRMAAAYADERIADWGPNPEVGCPAEEWRKVRRILLATHPTEASSPAGEEETT